MARLGIGHTETLETPHLEFGNLHDLSQYLILEQPMVFITCVQRSES